MMKKRRVTRRTAQRTDMVGVRFEPKIRYLTEIAARSSGDTVSGFVEKSVKKALALEKIGPHEETVSDYAEFLWDVDEADRFMKLALHFEGLLTHKEQVMWKVVKERCWRFGGDKRDCIRLAPPGGVLEAVGLNILDKGFPDRDKVRKNWDLLSTVAQEIKYEAALSKFDAISANSPAPPKSTKRPRKE